MKLTYNVLAAKKMRSFKPFGDVKFVIIIIRQVRLVFFQTPVCTDSTTGV